MTKRWCTAVVSLVAGMGLVAPVSPASAAPLGTLKVSDAGVHAGTTVKFMGQMPERIASRRVLLQVRGGGVWRTIERAYTKRDGRFVMREELNHSPGRYAFRVLGKPKRSLGIGESKTRIRWVGVSPRPGSQAAPWRPGQRFYVDNWSMVFGVTDQDAWPELSAENSYEDPPPPGWNYVSVPFSFTRTGPGSGEVFWDVSLHFVGSDGVVYDSFSEVNGQEYSCYLSNDWIDAPELYTGASATATDCLLVRESAIPGGMWRVEGDYDEPQHFITQS